MRRSSILRSARVDRMRQLDLLVVCFLVYFYAGYLEMGLSKGFPCKNKDTTTTAAPAAAAATTTTERTSVFENQTLSYKINN